MKYSVGYPQQNDDNFVDYIIENKENIYEVYFSWGNFSNGRKIQTSTDSYLPWEVQKRQISDLKRFSENKIALNLLLNATCYGDESLSRAFFNKVGDTIDYIKSEFGLKSVTTTSLIIAKFLKVNFKELNVRASINMCIGTTEGMAYVEKYFDSFYMKRECNRNIQQIHILKNWCENKGKELLMLANSGCLSNCSAHVFHDNLVAHENQISKMDNAYDFIGICHEYFRDRENLISFIRDMSYVRPEDIKLYDGLFTAVKLATRVNSNPKMVLQAYITGNYSGNLPELLEPNHSCSFYPYIIENKNLHVDFAKRILECDKICDKCDWCKKNFNSALVKLEDFDYANK